MLNLVEIGPLLASVCGPPRSNRTKKQFGQDFSSLFLSAFSRPQWPRLEVILLITRTHNMNFLNSFTSQPAAPAATKNHISVVIVGDAGSGKASLVNAFLGQPSPRTQ